jgi:hypothetical protein
VFLGGQGGLLHSERVIVLLEQFTHFGLSECDGNTVNAPFDSRPQIMCLESVLCAKLASSFCDCTLC